MNERPGAPQRTKRHGQILSSTCFPSRLCILKHERGASSLSRSWDNCHTSLTEENLLHVNIHRLAVLSCPAGFHSQRRWSRITRLALLSSLNDVCAVACVHKPPTPAEHRTDQRLSVRRLDVSLMRLSGSPLRLLCSLLFMWLWPVDADHPGVCPNHLNLNLWVDAQSTCERECQTDQVNRPSLSHCL